MQFNEALSIVLTLAKAHRVVAPIEGGVTEKKLDEAIQMVEERSDSLNQRPKKVKRVRK